MAKRIALVEAEQREKERKAEEVRHEEERASEVREISIKDAVILFLREQVDALESVWSKFGLGKFHRPDRYSDTYEFAVYPKKPKHPDKQNTARVPSPRAGNPIRQRDPPLTRRPETSATCWMTLSWASPVKRLRPSLTSSMTEIGGLLRVWCLGMRKMAIPVVVVVMAVLQASGTHGLGCAMLIVG